MWTLHCASAVLLYQIKVMTSPELKKKFMKLWKDTFHDSDAYISLVFDEYFDPEFIEYQEEKNQIVSALIGIPYEFGCGHNRIKGLYLCGLATKEEFRHKGIMSGLIDRINKKAMEKGLAMSFLIPASDMLRIYYQGKGYVNGMYRVEERYTDIHDFNKDCISLINREDDRLRSHRLKYYENLIVSKLEEDDSTLIAEIAKYISNKEQENNSYITLLHTEKDIENIIKENKISGGEILLVKNENNEIKGATFIVFDDRKRMIIQKIYFDDQCVFYKLLDKAKKMHAESPMSIWRFPEETDRHVIWSKVYGAANPDGGALGGAYGIAERVYDVNMHSLPYGMVKILNIHEILKFIAKYRTDAKFSILVKNEEHSEKGDLYIIESGKMTHKEIEGEEYKKISMSRSVTTLSLRDLSEIIFRKKDGNSLIMEAFGIPRLIINMALMLD